ncbi:MAG: sialate O-acetylesterase [Planctomycetota bacterium]
MQFTRTWICTCLLLVPLANSRIATAEVKPHALFSDGMVLQCDRPVPIWGTAAEGEEVTVEFEGQRQSAVTEDGRWMTWLAPLKAGGPFTMKISGSNEITIQEVLVGDVWICSGQSNMQWPLNKSENAEEVISSSANPRIRLLSVPRGPAAEPKRDLQVKWLECKSENVANFSAVGYYFGRDLEKARHVPIGLINTSYGGTPAEAWTSKEKLQADPLLEPILTRAAKEPVENPKRATGLYNAMIAPLVPYAIRGAIWYQGESNSGRAYEYARLFPTMIQNWREVWGQGDFPFLLVQLAPFMKIQEEPGDSAWAELREAQRFATHALPNTAMAVITDVGEENDIHPRKKAPVGARLALAARALAHGEPIVFSGPEYESVRIEGNKAFVRFRNVGKGLVAKNGTLTGFTIAGSDQKFHKANAEIAGNEVVVSSEHVPRPVAVRFGWANYPVVNLWNEEGLPASPFRTDDFPWTTARPKEDPPTRKAPGRAVREKLQKSS